MKVNIEIEQYDNGITLKWRDFDGELDGQNTVALDRDREALIGKTIWEDIKSVMDKNTANAVTMNITYEPRKEEKQ